MVDGGGEAPAQLLIHCAVDVGLHGQHVFGYELIAALEQFVDALDPVGIGPVVSDWKWCLGGGDAGVGGCKKA